MLDSSVLIPALRKKKGDEIAVDLLDALVDGRRSVLIPAPAWAEILRGTPKAVPRTRYMRVVAFDLLG
jgi:predicted nucleic acid-binding protein